MKFGPAGPYCQSCGMPLSSDEGKGGSEKDGSKSTLYCSHCYSNGQFVEPNVTVFEMQERVKEKLKQLYFPGFIAFYFTRDIPKLKRWAK